MSTAVLRIYTRLVVLPLFFFIFFLILFYVILQLVVHAASFMRLVMNVEIIIQQENFIEVNYFIDTNKCILNI